MVKWEIVRLIKKFEKSYKKYLGIGLNETEAILSLLYTIFFVELTRITFSFNSINIYAQIWYLYLTNQLNFLI